MIQYLFTHTALVFFVQDLWRDEAFSYLLSKKSFLEIIFLSVKDFSPPLFTMILKVWIMFFGSSEIALRSLSLFCFIGLLFVAFHFLLDVFKFDHVKSFLGMLFFFINPILLYYAFEARAYSMFAFLALLSFYAFFTGKKRLYVLATIAGLYTHYFMLLGVFSQIVYLKLTKGTHSREKLPWILRSLVAFLPWLIFVIMQRVTSSSQFWIEKVKLVDLFYLPSVLFTGYEKNFNFPDLNKFGYPTFLLLMSFFIMVTLLLGYKKIKKHHPHNLQLYTALISWTFLPVLVIFLISFIKPLYLPRYLILCVPGLLFLIIYSLTVVKKVWGLLIVFLLITLTFHYNTLQIKYRTKTHVSQILREMKGLVRPHDVIYVSSELDYFVVQYYVGENNVYIYSKNYEEIPDFVGKVLIPKNRIRNTLPSYPARAFVFNGYGYEIQTLY